MQKKGRTLIVTTALFTILFTLLVSGFSVLDFFEKTSQGIESITGRLTAIETGVNLTLAGRNGDIYYVENASTVSVSENSFTNVTISFYYSDPDGTGNMDPRRAKINMTKVGGSAVSPIYNYSSGCYSTADINSTVTNISCTVHMWYYYTPGEWNITVSYFEANGSFAAQNTTHNLTLSSTTAIQISPTNLTFSSSANPGEKNITSNNDPITVNNTGNVAAASGNVRITGRNLVGEVTKTQYIPALNFSVDVLNSTYSGGPPLGECNDGFDGQNSTNLTNATAQSINNSILVFGNHSINNGTSGIEHIFVCLKHIPLGISIQSYSTLELGEWVIDIA